MLMEQRPFKIKNIVVGKGEEISTWRHVGETGNNEKTGKYAAVERRCGMAVRKFKIKLEGKVYEAEVEEIIEGEAQNILRYKKGTGCANRASAAQTKTTSTGSSKTVVSPMPGKIITIMCAVGQP